MKLVHIQTGKPAVAGESVQSRLWPEALPLVRWSEPTSTEPQGVVWIKKDGLDLAAVPATFGLRFAE